MMIHDLLRVSGYHAFVGRNLVTWRSKKQPIIERSSVEANFQSIAYGVCELIWIQMVLTELMMGTSKRSLYIPPHKRVRYKMCIMCGLIRIFYG